MQVEKFNDEYTARDYRIGVWINVAAVAAYLALVLYAYTVK